ncbi:MAG TPA: hypothetical protein VHW00_14590 [Thermoanaerobaculia bacterium]|nr:hypothetical protein [Thermoanaerobaculia bacterium]
MSLEQQIATWRQLRSDLSGACHVNRITWLNDVARNGGPAARAMVPFLTDKDAGFAAEDAAYVIYAVQLKHCDLESQGPLEALRWAADRHPDASVRQTATRYVENLHADSPPKRPCN